MTVKPYKLKISKISSHEYSVARALSSIVTKDFKSDKLIEAINRQLKKDAGASIKVEYKGFEEKAFGSFIDTCPITTLSIVIDMPTHEKPVFALVGKDLACALINSTLGGKGEDSERKNLSQSECGILEYIITKLLRSIHKSNKGKGSPNLLLEKIIDDPRSLRSYSRPDDSIILLKFRIIWEKNDYLLRLVIPHAVLEKVDYGQKSASESDPKEIKTIKKQLMRYGFFEMPVSAEIGKVEVSIQDIERLEEGDVVLLDEATAFLEKGKLKGNADIVVGDDQLRLKSEIELKKGRVRCKILGLK